MPAASQAIYDAITQSRDALQAASAHDVDMNAVIAALSGSADPNVQSLVSAYQQKSAVITSVGSGLGALAGQYGGFNTGVGQAAAAAQQLVDSYKVINDSISRISLDGLNQLIAGIQQLKVQYGQLDTGITEYTQGFAQIASGYGDVYVGIAALADGLSSMEAGVKKFSGGAESLSAGARELSDGTDELRDRTSDMDTVVDDKVNEMVNEYTNDNYTLVSFVSEKNTNIKLVQFVIKIEGVSLPEDDTIAASAEPAQSQSFWDKLLGLF
jgi:putative membrane protein